MPCLCRLVPSQWNWNQAFRQTDAYKGRPFRKEQGKPDRVCVSYTHDRDYEAITGEPRPAGQEKFARTAWCPPPHAEYDRFVGKGGRYGDEHESPPRFLSKHLL